MTVNCQICHNIVIFFCMLTATRQLLIKVTDRNRIKYGVLDHHSSQVRKSFIYNIPYIKARSTSSTWLTEHKYPECIDLHTTPMSGGPLLEPSAGIVQRCPMRVLNTLRASLKLRLSWRRFMLFYSNVTNSFSNCYKITE